MQFRVPSAQNLFPLSEQPNAGQDHLIAEVSTSHHSRQDSSGRVIGRRWNPYLTTRGSHKREASVTLMGFEPTITTSERPQTVVVDSLVTGSDITALTGKVTASAQRKPVSSWGFCHHCYVVRSVGTWSCVIRLVRTDVAAPLPWRLRKQIPLIHWYLSTSLHEVTICRPKSLW
jgi:hypothetical protein